MTLPKNIVIVEDEAITQRYLKDILEQYDVVISGCFDNAKDAKEGLKHCECDMLLMDINIKGSVDGIQLASELVKPYDFPIIFITAHNDDNTFQEALELTPYGFIEKPFNSRDIVFSLQLAYKRYLEDSKRPATKVQEQSDTVVINKSFTYSRELKTLYHNNKAVKLNVKQQTLIDVLVQNLNTAVSYDVLTLAIWEDNIVADSALRTLVYGIRKDHPDLPLVSHSKVGYCMERDLAIG